MLSFLSAGTGEAMVLCVGFSLRLEPGVVSRLVSGRDIVKQKTVIVMDGTVLILLPGCLR